MKHELRVIRSVFYKEDCQGSLLFDGVHQCATLEPTDRGLDCDMPIAKIASIKIPGLTAIPVNTPAISEYKVVCMFWGAPHNKWVPTLVNVPDYSGVGIHSVGTVSDTLGCLGIGTASAGENLEAGGFIARDALYAKMGVPTVGTAGSSGQIMPWANGDEYSISYQRDGAAWEAFKSQAQP